MPLRASATDRCAGRRGPPGAGAARTSGPGPRRALGADAEVAGERVGAARAAADRRPDPDQAAVGTASGSATLLPPRSLILRVTVDRRSAARRSMLLAGPVPRCRISADHRDAPGPGPWSPSTPRRARGADARLLRRRLLRGVAAAARHRHAGGQGTVGGGRRRRHRERSGARRAPEQPAGARREVGAARRQGRAGGDRRGRAGPGAGRGTGRRR